MPKFRKKPVEIEAHQFDGTIDSVGFISNWINTNGGQAWRAYKADREIEIVVISTLEGDMSTTPGDWVIKGVQGEFYPCKPDIFEATYDLVEE